MKKFAYLFFVLYFLLAFFTPVFANTTCREKYLNSIGQCAADCQTIGDNYLTDSASGLCDLGQVCCHQVASTGGDIASVLELQIPLFDYAQASNLPEYIITLYKYLLIIIVPLAIIMIIIGGVHWITSAGNQGQITKAKSYIINAFIGLLLALGSYILLSLVGINELKTPYVEYIPEVFVNNETGGADACDETKPSCVSKNSSYNNNNFLIHEAEAAKAPVPLLKQWKAPYDNTKFGICGTVKTSGCGITSLTMVLSYLTGTNVSLVDMAKKAADAGYRKCPPGAKWDEALQDCPTCKGTDYAIFRAGSKILNEYGLTGDNLMGKNPITKILGHLKKSEPVIISVSGADIGDGGNPNKTPAKKGNRFTMGGHFIVLTGCENCDSKDFKNVPLWVNDPNRANESMTLKELQVSGFLNSAHWVHK